ncbi:MAG TPA: redoxin domain-containing protein [Candidatus Pacearchaeota archaeon]|jgi:peroxiredoxin (alkyl hydroperoxide reductase subunit C)|nr:redoxin domain-containing protein [Candidatus Pacearchaeota archaeon]|tara:strand:- start:4 stop:582 length:579 start_codon:yes stop_codon:yes gene_type:complete
MESEDKLIINELAPDFNAEAFVDEDVKKISLSDYRGKWVVLFFYPADFTFVCPTELGDLADNYEKFKELGAEIISVSTDTVFVHKAWHDNSETIKKIKFPMLADPTTKVCRKYQTLIAEEGLSLRATFLIDPDGILKAYEFHDNSIGRSSQELIRKIQAAKFVKENQGKVCPMNWEPDSETLTPGLDLVGKI